MNDDIEVVEGKLRRAVATARERGWELKRMSEKSVGGGTFSALEDRCCLLGAVLVANCETGRDPRDAGTFYVAAEHLGIEAGAAGLISDGFEDPGDWLGAEGLLGLGARLGLELYPLPAAGVQ